MRRRLGEEFFKLIDDQEQAVRTGLSKPLIDKGCRMDLLSIELLAQLLSTDHQFNRRPIGLQP